MDDDLKFTLEDDELSLDADNDIVLSDDEIKLRKSKPKFKPKPRSSAMPRRIPVQKTISRPPVANAMPMNSPPQQHEHPPVFTDKTFEAFSNPQKRMHQSANNDDEDDDDGMSHAESAETAGYGNDLPPDDHFEGSNTVPPSHGFATIDDEKQDLLYRFHRLEAKGIKIPKKYNMYSDVREMRSDFDRIKRDHEVNASIKFSKRMLMAVVSASEFINKRYDPFGIELNGWSETVMENANDGDFDNVFERLHDKYAGKVNTPPEIELMLSLAGSAIMFHMTSTMFKSIPSMGAGNPEMQQAMNNIAQNIMKQQKPKNDDQSAEPTDPGHRRKMKGPSVNLSSIGGMMPPPMPSSSFMNKSTISELNSDDDVMSDVSGLSVKQVSVTAGGTRRGRKPKIQSTVDNTIDI